MRVPDASAAGLRRTLSGRILQRTAIGLGLIGVVSGLLWFVDSRGEKLPLLALTLLFGLGGIHELARMGGEGRGGRIFVLLAATSALLPIWWAADLATPFAVLHAYLLVLATAAVASACVELIARRGGGPLMQVLLLAAAVVSGLGLGRLAPLQSLVVCGLLASGLVLLRRGFRAVAPLPLVGLALWLVFPLPALLGVWTEFQIGGLIALILLSKIGDIAGYYVGSSIGRTHPFPRISPGKTTAGCVGSLAAGTLAALGAVELGLVAPGPWGLAGVLLAGATVNLASQAGDLLESAVKRRAGVKDSGTWFGPAGGVLDLVDSLLLSVPVALCVWPFLLEFGSS